MSSTPITDIKALMVFDSRGVPTVEVSVTAGGTTESFAVPSGASTGKHEALELRDGIKDSFSGRGIDLALNNVNVVIRDRLLSLPVDNQREIDEKLRDIDGTENLSKLGANAALGISVACAKVAAKLKGVPLYSYIKQLLPKGEEVKLRLPYIFANLINGGQHAPTGPAIQEYQVVPLTRSIRESTEAIFDIQNEIPNYLAEEGSPIGGTGDEGGYVIQEKNITRPLEILWEIATKTGHDQTIKLGIDAAASSFYKSKELTAPYQLDNERKWTRERLTDWYRDISEELPMISIEDPFFEDDFGSFQALQSSLPEILVIGDDLTVTNPNRIKTAIKSNAINAIIIKPNQIGTLTKTLEAISLCQANNIKTIVSHRSGETNDDFIADLAVGTGAYGVKIGALKHGERIAKYNRLLKIEAELSSSQ